MQESVQAQQASFSLVQPGSSVATALSEGESKKKHVLMLEICGDDWRSVKFPLDTVRPFMFESVSVTAHACVTSLQSGPSHPEQDHRSSTD